MSGRETHSHYFHIEVPIPATPEVMTGRVTAMNQALERLARDIAGSLSGPRVSRPARR